MNLRDIAAFIAVAETGSVNHAARRLNLTQPAMTRRTQIFEAAMGQPALFDRSVKPAVLTSLGRNVLELCRRVLSAVADVTIVEFESEEALQAWRVHPEHAQAKRAGIKSLSSEYSFQICRVIRDRTWASRGVATD